MRDLRQSIQATSVPSGSTAIWWLGQAGFAFKTAGGSVLYLDPYLSDVVEKVAGFKRLSLPPIAAQDVQADWVISSHEHPDHLDTDALPVIAANNPRCRFAGSTACKPEYDRCKIAAERQLIMEPDGTYELGDVTVHAGKADHGTFSPSALALVLNFGSVKVMFTGDTAMSMELLQPLIELNPDVLLPCINGAYGNLNANEAAQLAARVGPKVVIPCHFWMFKEHHVTEGGDPETFARACANACPDVRVLFLCPGEGIVMCADSILPAR